jgi:hypothetical protein
MANKWRLAVIVTELGANENRLSELSRQGSKRCSRAWRAADAVKRVEAPMRRWAVASIGKIRELAAVIGEHRMHLERDRAFRKVMAVLRFGFSGSWAKAILEVQSMREEMELAL